MKRLSLLLLGFIVTTFHLLAYDYQTVYSQRTALFADSFGSIKAMRIDSVRFAQDSILYPFKDIQKSETYCYTPFGASWLGAKIIVKPNWNYFFNAYNDTIKIKTDAKLNESWGFFSISGILVSATVQKVELLTCMDGLVDSVKTIGFSVVIPTSSDAPSKANADLSTSFDGQTIQISKHYGFLKTFNFLVFPYPNEYEQTYTNVWQKYGLVGLTNPTVGVQNLTWFDVFDFQVGDELHIVEKNTPPLGGVPLNYVFEKDKIIKYVGRQDFQDSIKYSIQVSERTLSQTSGVEKLTKTSYSTTTQLVNKNLAFDILPEVPFIDTYSANKYSMHYDGVTTSKCEPTISSEIHRTSDSCWSLIIVDGCIPTYSYTKGLGGPYYSCSGMGGEEDTRLVYYKKGLSTWGIPLVITGTNQPIAMSEIEIYLNPTTDKLTINHDLPPGESTFELLDLQGKVIQKQIISDDENQLSLANFSKGLYLYRLINNGKLLKAGKIVKM